MPRPASGGKHVVCSLAGRPNRHGSSGLPHNAFDSPNGFPGCRRGRRSGASEWCHPPTILVQPQSQRVAVGADVAYSVIVTGTPPFSYRWRLNETNLPAAEATNATLALRNVQVAQAGDYSVVITNLLGSVTSAVATLTVSQPTTITAAVYNAASGQMTFSFATVLGSTYIIEYKNTLDDPAWQTLETIPGDGSVKTFEDPVQQPPPPQRFYRVRTE